MPNTEFDLKKVDYSWAQIQAAYNHLIPRIGESGNWEVWDIEAMDWADTGINAKIRSIVSIEKTDTDGVVDIYTITFDDGATWDYTVTNGNGIKGIEKTDTQGLVDTYTITFDNGTTTTFTVKNGNGVTGFSKTSTEGLVDTYTMTMADGTTYTIQVKNGRDGTGSVVSVNGVAPDEVGNVTLSWTDISGANSIKKGGTGAKTAAAGLANLINGAGALDSSGLDTADLLALLDASGKTGAKVSLGDLAKFLGASTANPNLLFNWNFANPIDPGEGCIVPAGTTVYTNTALTAGATSFVYSLRVTEMCNSYYTVYDVYNSATYYAPTGVNLRHGYVAVGSQSKTIKGWYSATGWGNVPLTVELDDDGILLATEVPASGFYSTGFNQKIPSGLSEALDGLTVTLSAWVESCTPNSAGTHPALVTGKSWPTGGQLIPSTKVAEISETGLISGTFTWDAEKYDAIGVQLPTDTTSGSSTKISKVKLEIGQKSTLSQKSTLDYIRDMAFAKSLYSGAMQVGSYTGNGATGVDTMRLTLPFAPKLVILHDTNNNFGVWAGGATMWVFASNSHYSVSTKVIDIDEQTLWWGSTVDAAAQLNVNGVTVNYVAFGDDI